MTPTSELNHRRQDSERCRWVERRRQQLRSPLQRRLNRSFKLRLLLALTGAILGLTVVNRWEQCRDQGFARGCVLHDAGGVVSVDNLEALSIVTAAVLFVLERGKRRQHEHTEAMELILTCQQAGVRFSLARNEAIELLCEAGLSFDGFDLSALDLGGLHAPGALWAKVKLAGSSLQEATLRHADLKGADLKGADLKGADLQGADLRDTDLRDTDLSEADLRGALLVGVDLSRAVLTGAKLDGSQHTLKGSPADHPV